MNENDQDKNQKQINLDILHHIERLSGMVNQMMESRTRSVSARYPLSFILLVLVGVVAVSEGLKGVLEDIGFVGHPWFMLVLGLCILIITGTAYKKLDK